MFSRNGEPPAAPLPKKTWSITSRLTAHYAISAFLIFNMSLALLYWALTTILDKQSMRYLNDEISVIRNVLLLPHNTALVAQKLEVGYAAREFMKTYGRVVDHQGKVLAETYQMAELLPVTLFPPPTQGDSFEVRSVGSGAEQKKFMMRSASLGGTGSDSLTLQIALDTTYLHHILNDYRKVLIAVTLVGTVISACLGAYIVRREMRPLGELTERTRRISSSNLDERITLSHWPREMHSLAAAFDEMLDRLRESFERLSTYVSNMAHELRTPINILLGEAEVALSQARDADDYRRVIESNIEEYQRLSRTIDSLLFIARSDMKESPLTLEAVNICRELEQMVEYYTPIMEDKEITVSCSGEGMLLADRTLFRRALSNLLANALHYTPSGGQVTVAAHRGDDGTIALTVSDTGCGISEEEIPRVLERFYRAEGTRTLHPHGSGLGLAIVKTIMELHNGTISISSEVSRGTTVTLRFPPPGQSQSRA